MTRTSHIHDRRDLNVITVFSRTPIDHISLHSHICSHIPDFHVRRHTRASHLTHPGWCCMSGGSSAFCRPTCFSSSYTRTSTHLPVCGYLVRIATQWVRLWPPSGWGGVGVIELQKRGAGAPDVGDILRMMCMGCKDLAVADMWYTHTTAAALFWQKDICMCCHALKNKIAIYIRHTEHKCARAHTHKHTHIHTFTPHLKVTVPCGSWLATTPTPVTARGGPTCSSSTISTPPWAARYVQKKSADLYCSCDCCYEAWIDPNNNIIHIYYSIVY